MVTNEKERRILKKFIKGFGNNARIISGASLILISLLISISVCLVSFGPSHTSFAPFEISSSKSHLSGSFGIYIDSLLKNYFGYFFLSLSAILFIWGLARLKKIPLKSVGLIFLYLISYHIILATLIGLIGGELARNLVGITGFSLAEYARHFFGNVGAFMVVILFFFALTYSLSDIKLSEVIKKVKEYFRQKKKKKEIREEKERERLIKEYKQKFEGQKEPDKKVGDLTPGVSYKEGENKDLDDDFKTESSDELQSDKIDFPINFSPDSLTDDKKEEKSPSPQGKEARESKDQDFRERIKKEKNKERPETPSESPETEDKQVEDPSEKQTRDSKTSQPSRSAPPNSVRKDEKTENQKGTSTSKTSQEESTQGKKVDATSSDLENITRSLYSGKKESNNKKEGKKSPSSNQQYGKGVVEDFRPPPLKFLESAPKKSTGADKEELTEKSEKIVKKLSAFNIDGEVKNITAGPVISRFEFKPATDIKVKKIVNLSDDLAMALKASDIRIVAPIPGKGTVGIEIPNNEQEIVYLRNVLNSDAFVENEGDLLIGLGKNVPGAPVAADLGRMPHLLIAGATGSGKSVCINSIITSLIYRLPPEKVRFILVDPKLLELSVYEDIPYLRGPIITEPSKAVTALKWAVKEMERRYDLLAKAQVRKLPKYNEIAKREGSQFEYLPYEVIIIDELADLMMTASKEVEEPIARIAQKARAVGMHLIIATQRPSVDVVTGLIKANIPCRMAFKVRSAVDSRTILDTGGAENLIGRGDMLYLASGLADPIRIHGSFVSTEETHRIVDYLKQFKNPYEEDFLSFDEIEEKQEMIEERDELFFDAAEIVIKSNKGSSSLLQRKLSIGYTRAARIIDQLEAAGIVGGFRGSKARKVLVDDLSYLEELKEQDDV